MPLKKLLPAPVKLKIKQVLSQIGLSSGSLLDQYVKSAPSEQLALDVFRGQWNSKLGDPFASLSAGSAKLFQDPRVLWALDELGGVKDRTVLELGPLEAGHSYLMQKNGASSVVAVEANTRAYLKCLIVKEIFQLDRVRFLLGDCVEYLKAEPRQFDVILAHGVLYHMVNPVELLSLLSKATSRLTLWTHYFDEAVLRNHSAKHHFDFVPCPTQYEGFSCTLYRQSYDSAIFAGGFCGGGNSFSQWMKRDEILGALRHFGFTDIKVAFDDPSGKNGPSFAVTAIR